MEKLYDKCRDIILKSTSCRDEDILDYLTISFMALYTLKGYIVLDKLPSVIENITINRIDNNRVKLDIGILCEDGKVKCKNMLSFPKEIDLSEYYGIIENTVYFLVTLLRVKKISTDSKHVEIKTGISSKKFGLDGSVSNGRGCFLEKGITNLLVRDSMISLKNYLSDEYEDSINDDHYSELVRDKNFVYDVRVYLIEKLLADAKFASLVDQTFDDLDDRGFAKGYNDIMDNDAAYSNLNKLFDNLSQALVSSDEESIYKNISGICDEITGLMNKGSQYKKNI